VSDSIAGQTGGGIFLVDSEVEIINSTVTGNTASEAGGGIALYGSTVTITNCTISDNTAPDGSAIQNSQGTITLKNSIIAENNGPGFGGDAPEPGIYNLTDFEMHVAVVGFTQVDDMKLEPLADNGGPTHTHALLSGSPAIDAGGDSVCSDIDQRGIARPKDGDNDGVAHCDVGAYEY
jgi:parallel beta-helix repeat protein